ncbi:MAG: ADP-ribosylglycohydrolase family protein [Pirellula sp.]
MTFPVAWSTIIPTKRRQEAIEGLLLGCAVAEALSIQYSALPPRTKHSMRRGPVGVLTSMQAMPGHRTHSIVMAVQSLLTSKADIEPFLAMLQSRLAWYRSSHPMRAMLGRVSGSMRAELDNDPLIRSALLSVVLQGHNESARTWISHSTKYACTDEVVVRAAMLVAMAAQCAQVLRTNHPFDPQQLLPFMADHVGDDSLRRSLMRLDQLLAQRASVNRAARSLGCMRGVHDHLIENALLAIYTFCLHSASYRMGIEAVVRLPGDTTGIASLAGCLLGAAGGVRSIPESWLDRVSMQPYNDEWIAEYVERVHDWPHGPEDIQATASLSALPMGQLWRNAVQVIADAQLQWIRWGLKRPRVRA